MNSVVELTLLQEMYGAVEQVESNDVLAENHDVLAAEEDEEEHISALNIVGMRMIHSRRFMIKLLGLRILTVRKATTGLFQEYGTPEMSIENQLEGCCIWEMKNDYYCTFLNFHLYKSLGDSK